jgi:HEAT repeat protein
LVVTIAGLLIPVAPAAGGDPEKTQKLIAVLQSEAALFDKARACQQLGEIGTKEAVPALAALLADEHLSAYARSGLEGIPDPSAAEALRAATGTLKGNLLAGAINSLGVLRDAKAVPILRKLAAEPASGVAKEALLALGRISTSESISVVRQALTEGPEAVRSDAAAACLLAAEKQSVDGQADTALALYDAVRTAQVPVTYRVGATRGAILALKSNGVPFLIEQLRSDDRAIRNAALITVREIPSDTLASALNAELEKATPELQIQLLTALIDCHNPQSLQVIQAKAASGDPEIRKAALTALGRIGGPAEAWVLLKAIADNRSPDESALALGGLRRMEGVVVDGLILKTLASTSDAGTRIKLIHLVEGRGVTNAAGELLKQAAEPDARVSVAALGALKSLAGPQELAALIAFTKACKDDAVRDAAESAVCSVCTRTGSAAAGGEAVLSELKQVTVPTEKNSWIRILTCLGYAPALPIIKTAVSDPDEAVAANAINQLGRWPDPTPIADLFAVVETGANAARRKRALLSVIQLARKAADERQRPAETVVGWLQRANQAAQTIEERRLILSGLGRLPHIESLRLLVPYLDDPALQAEAAAAVVQIAPTLAKLADAAPLKAALEKIVATVQNADIRDQAAKIAKTMPGKK